MLSSITQETARKRQNKRYAPISAKIALIQPLKLTSDKRLFKYQPKPIPIGAIKRSGQDKDRVCLVIIPDKR